MERMVWHNQQVLLALVGGAVWLLLVVLCYLAMWQRRDTEHLMTEASTPNWRIMLRYMPWILLVVYVATFAFAVIYIIANAGHAPNW